MKYPLLDLIKQLADKYQVDVNEKDILGHNCLFYLSTNNKEIKKISFSTFDRTLDYLLFEKNVYVNQNDIDGNTLFLLSAKNWENERIKFYTAG